MLKNMLSSVDTKAASDVIDMTDMTAITRAITDSLSHVSTQPIALHEPCFNGNEKQYTADCIESGWVSSVGQYVTTFEQALSHVTGIPHIIATVNGTAALHLGLHALGIGPDDEVLLPALTFVATANAVAYTGATPHFVDACPVTLGVDAVKLRHYLTQLLDKHGRNRHTGKRIRCLIVMHALGQPAALSELQAVCDDFGLMLIEDAAESLGSTYKGQHTGGFGRLGIFSFNGNKIITTGGGGAIATHDEALATRLRHLSQTAKVVQAEQPWAFFHDDVGFNYRLPNINAALGVAQLEQLPVFLAKKEALALHYARSLGDTLQDQDFILNTAKTGTRPNYWLNALRLPQGCTRQDRDAMMSTLSQAGIQVRPLWTTMAQLPMYKTAPRMDLDTTDALERQIICLPSSASLAP